MALCVCILFWPKMQCKQLGGGGKAMAAHWQAHVTFSLCLSLSLSVSLSLLLAALQGHLMRIGAGMLWRPRACTFHCGCPCLPGASTSACKNGEKGDKLRSGEERGRVLLGVTHESRQCTQ